MHNDVSFLIAGDLNLYEQQSTFNPNMPLRLMQYLGSQYEKYITEHGYNKYGKDLIPLPVPKLVVFYNGTDAKPDEMFLHLRDSFPKEKQGELDVDISVRMININHGKSKAILSACKPLQEYAWFIQTIRENAKVIRKAKKVEEKKADQELDKAEKKQRNREALSEAVKLTIREMPEDYLLKPFLIAHDAEVNGMLLTEYDEAQVMELFRKDGEKKSFILMRKLFEQGRACQEGGV